VLWWQVAGEDRCAGSGRGGHPLDRGGPPQRVGRGAARLPAALLGEATELEVSQAEQPGGPPAHQGADGAGADVGRLAVQVAGVGRLEGPVRQALADVVHRAEILDHARPFLEVGPHRRLEDGHAGNSLGKKREVKPPWRTDDRWSVPRRGGGGRGLGFAFAPTARGRAGAPLGRPARARGSLDSTMRLWRLPDPPAARDRRWPRHPRPRPLGGPSSVAVLSGQPDGPLVSNFGGNFLAHGPNLVVGGADHCSNSQFSAVPFTTPTNFGP